MPKTRNIVPKIRNIVPKIRNIVPKIHHFVPSSLNMEAIRRMCCRRNKGECLSKVQSDQLYMALCFWYTCKTELVQCELLRSMPTVLTQRHFHLLWKNLNF